MTREGFFSGGFGLRIGPNVCTGGTAEKMSKAACRVGNLDGPASAAQKIPDWLAPIARLSDVSF